MTTPTSQPPAGQQDRGEAEKYRSLLVEWLDGTYDSSDFLRRVKLACSTGLKLATVGEATAKKDRGKSAKQRYDELMPNDDALPPIEKLRLFCALSMGGEDFLDVEPFFDALDSEATAAQQDGWISVDERLPEGGEMVLVSVRNGTASSDPESAHFEAEEVRVVDFGDYNEPGGYMQCYGGPHGAFADDITHWMPTPLPPKENT